jgi:hypothetical protein
MSYEFTKKSLISVKLISYIIINILKLRELHTSIQSNSFINKLYLIKDVSKIGLDIVSFNILSILVNTLPYYHKLKKIKNYIKNKFYKIKNDNQ